MGRASRAITLLLVAAVIAGIVFLLQPDTPEGDIVDENVAASIEE